MTHLPATEVKNAMIEYFVNSAGLPPEAVSSGDVKVEDLGIDSLSMIEMLWEVEEKYGLRVEDIKVLKGMTIDGMAEYISGLLPADSA
jgi:acyl carrier protein